MAAGEAKRFVLPLQTAHHQTSFERRNNQSGQFRSTNSGTNLALSLALLDDRFQTTQPRMKSLPSFAAEPRVSVIGFDGSVQKRTSSGHQAGTSFPKVPQELVQA